MKAAIHYIVKAKLIRFIKDGEVNFLEFNEKFENSNPILAREEAFRFYQNYIDVLLEGKNKKYYNDRDARENLNSFIDPGTSTKIKIGDELVEFKDSYGNGIGVYFVVDRPMQHDIFDDKIGDEFLIHGIGQSVWNDPQSLMDSLNHEFEYYQHFGYEIKDYKREVNFYEYDIEEAEINEILDTPFNWTGYDVPYYGESIYDEESEIENEKLENVEISKSYKQLIEGGENNQVEFKPCLLYYHDKEKENSGYRMFIRHIIAKVICSFLNSNGGYLFVGVQDDKRLTGLSDDFSLVRPIGKDPKDYFTLEVDKIIREYFKNFASNISGEFTVIDGVEIYVFTVFPSKHRPVFIKGQQGKEFYVRLMGSCEPYTDIEDITAYCIEKWGQ
jgi:hypothetical protein